MYVNRKKKCCRINSVVFVRGSVSFFYDYNASISNTSVDTDGTERLLRLTSAKAVRLVVRQKNTPKCEK